MSINHYTIPPTTHSTLTPTHYQVRDMHHAIVVVERYFIMHSQRSVEYESMGTALIAHIH